MRLHFIRNFFRNLNGVKYKECEVCRGPISRENPDSHVCDSESVPLRFVFTDLTSRADSGHFVHRVKSAGFLRALRIWYNSYVTGFESTLEDYVSGELTLSNSGQPSAEDKSVLFTFAKAEYVNSVDYGCDFHGLYALAVTTNKGRVLKVGSTQHLMKNLNFSNELGVVGLFGAISEAIDHVGFFLTSMKQTNFERNRAALLIRYKAKDHEVATIVQKLDPYLFRYLVSFL